MYFNLSPLSWGLPRRLSISVKKHSPLRGSLLHQYCSGTPPDFDWNEFLKKQNTAAKSLQSCLTLCDPIDGSPPGSPVPRILQARTLECVAISFSNAWKWKVKVKLLSRVQLLATPWTAAHQAPPSMQFSRQEYWSGVPSSSLKKQNSQTQISISKTKTDGIGY